MRQRLTETAPDVVPALLVTALAFSELGGDAFPGSKGAHAVAIVLIGAALVFRRRRPGASATLVAVVIAAQSLLAAHTPESAGEFLAVLLSLFSVAAHGHGHERRLALAAQIAANAVAISRDPNVQSFDEALPGVVIALAAWWIGDLVGHRTDQASRAEAARLEAEARREAEAREAVAVERARIAREIHDVVAHGLGAVVLQAGAARLEAPDEAMADRMKVIERTGRQSLLELRRLLGLLRRAGDGAPLAPQPTLDGLETLAAPARSSGVDVRIEVDPALGALPPGVELSAYRIVQEALTNVVKHAGASTCEVRLRRRNGSLDIEVADDGAGEPAASPDGFGLIGMRERVQVYGGSMEAGPRPGGGFAVRARLPVEAE